MSLKMMKKKLMVSALVAMGSLAVVACGDSEDDKDSGTDTPDEDGGGGGMGGTDGGGENKPATITRSGTLVPITATDDSAPILIPHKLVVLDNISGDPLTPSLTAMTAASNGKWSISGIPTDKDTALHVQGTGDDKTGTYDSIICNVKWNSPDDPLTRISSANTAGVAGQTGGFTAKQDQSAMSGGVYVVKGGKRVGAIGCAQVYIDDEPHPATKYDERYIASSGLPTTLDMQDKTLKGRGTFLFGNLSKGKHHVKVTTDGGKTFFYETDVYITKVRDDATSNYKAVLYQVGLDVPDGDKYEPKDCK